MGTGVWNKIKYKFGVYMKKETADEWWKSLNHGQKANLFLKSQKGFYHEIDSNIDYINSWWKSLSVAKKGNLYGELFQYEIALIEQYLNDWKRLLSEMKDEPDRSLAIITATFIDKVITDVFEKRLHTPTLSNTKLNEFNNNLYKNNGALSTLNNRCQLALVLGWLSEESYENANIIRDIRNKFAHRLFDIDFSDEKVKGKINNLTPNLRDYLGAIETDWDKVEKNTRLNYELRVIFALSEIVWEIVFFSSNFTIERVFPNFYNEKSEIVDRFYNKLAGTAMTLIIQKKIKVLVDGKPVMKENNSASQSTGTK